MSQSIFQFLKVLLMEFAKILHRYKIKSWDQTSAHYAILNQNSS